MQPQAAGWRMETASASFSLASSRLWNRALCVGEASARADTIAMMPHHAEISASQARGTIALQLARASVRQNLVIQERAQLPRPARMLQLAQRLRLDLPDAFARHGKLLSHLLQRMIRVHADPEPHTQYTLFPRR